MKIRLRGKGQAALIWAVLLPLFYLPVCIVLGRVVWETPGRAAFIGFVASPACRKILGFVLWESLLSALGSVLLSLPGAYFVGRYRFRGKRIFRGLLVLPFVLPSILAVLAMVVAYGRNGYANYFLRLCLGPDAPQFGGLYGLAGIVLTHVFFNFALGIRIIGEAWERLDPLLGEAANSLGASPAKVWWTVTLPLIGPAVAAAFVLAFVYASLSFTTVLVFGGLRYRTFEVLIYTRLNQDLDFLGAYAVAAVQMLLTGALLVLRARVTRRRRQVSSAFGLPRSLPLPTGWPRLVFGGYGLALLLFYLGPLGGLLLRACRERGFPDGSLTGANFAALFGPGFRTGAGEGFWPVLLTSLGLALVTGLAVMAVAYLLAVLRDEAPAGAVDAAIELPMGASLVTLCFGLLTLCGRVLPPVVLVIWAQVVMGLPLSYIVIRGARAEHRAELEQAARSLGATWWRAKLDVELPLMRRALMTAFAYGAAFSLGDVAAVLILGQGRVQTLAVAVYRLLGHYRFPQALALGSLLLVLSLGLFLLADRAGEQGGGLF